MWDYLLSLAVIDLLPTYTSYKIASATHLQQQKPLPEAMSL